MFIYWYSSYYIRTWVLYYSYYVRAWVLYYIRYSVEIEIAPYSMPQRMYVVKNSFDWEPHSFAFHSISSHGGGYISYDSGFADSKSYIGSGSDVIGSCISDVIPGGISFISCGSGFVYSDSRSVQFVSKVLNNGETCIAQISSAHANFVARSDRVTVNQIPVFAETTGTHYCNRNGASHYTLSNMTTYKVRMEM